MIRIRQTAISLTLPALIVLLLSLSMSAQEEQQNYASRGVGLSASLQSTQLDILLPIWVNPRFSFAPGISLATAEDVGTDIGVGVALKMYAALKKLSRFVGVRFAALIFNPKEGDSATDWLAGIGIGGEYFLDKHFSLGVEAQINATFSAETSSRFGNPGGTNINTGSVIFATVYF